ncbi:hypothetical protein GLW04_16190 [Halobacillus litoralis]|uniref:Uncharacterized protein n=2 Tax=Halobacillus litoralis TaxID=45668 RepID=A0A845E6Y2_9BACI|nr:hypothetical protein [Halobacillus litoralis]MYL21444.1 hypothetical protein [Halobacillus litoralis]
MKSMTLMFLELIRILVMLPLIGGLLWYTVFGPLYEVFQVPEGYRIIGAAGIWVFLFILYRNFLQFTGWYKGKENRKLPRLAVISLTVVSLFMTVGPLFARFL